MDESQAVAETEIITKVDDKNSRTGNQEFLLSPQQQLWVDYEALGGIITDSTYEEFNSETGKNQAKLIRKVTVSQFADMIGVDRKSLQRWRKTIPNFWDLVAKRRIELNGQSRIAALHEKWYVQAMTFKNWAITEAFLINFDPNYKTPRVKVEHEVGDNYAALLQAAASAGIIEGEGRVIEQADTRTSNSD